MNTFLKWKNYYSQCVILVCLLPFPLQLWPGMTCFYLGLRTGNPCLSWLKNKVDRSRSRTWKIISLHKGSYKFSRVQVVTILSLGKSAKAMWGDGSRTQPWLREAGSRKISEMVVEGHLHFTERIWASSAWELGQRTLMGSFKTKCVGH